MFDFPNSPAVNQIVVGPNNVQYRWTGTLWQATPLPNLYAPINSPVFTGNPTGPNPPVGDASQSLATTQFVGNAALPLTHNTGRNLLHNGLFNVQQRGAGPWTAGGYTADRWLASIASDTVSITPVVLTDADRTALGDEAMQNALQVVFTGSSTTNAQTAICQRVEDVRRLSGKQLTASFWARATSGTPRVGLASYQFFGAGGSPSAPVITAFGTTAALSGTWTRYTITGTAPSTSGKTFGTTAATSYEQFTLVLSDQGNQYGLGLGVQSGTVQFIGEQWEIGSVATPLEKRDPMLELALCQRFTSLVGIAWSGYLTAGQGYAASAMLPVTMRANPTLTISTNGSGNVGSITLSFVYNTVVATATAAATASGNIWVTVFASADL